MRWKGRWALRFAALVTLVLAVLTGREFMEPIVWWIRRGAGWTLYPPGYFDHLRLMLADTLVLSGMTIYLLILSLRKPPA
jgi:hypothetical protein